MAHKRSLLQLGRALGSLPDMPASSGDKGVGVAAQLTKGGWSERKKGMAIAGAGVGNQEGRSQRMGNAGPMDRGHP